MIKPLGFRVLVKKDDIETETDSGLVLVRDERLEQHRVNTGIVVAIGELAWKAYSNDYTGEPWCAVGQYVAWSEYSGKELTDPYSGVDYTILNDEDVICVFIEEDK